MDDATLRRVAENESRYRALNERQVGATADFRSSRPGCIAVACECAFVGCELMLDLQPAEYAGVRADPTHFIVSPDHAAPAIERIIARGPLFWIVEKTGAGAKVARERA